MKNFAIIALLATAALVLLHAEAFRVTANNHNQARITSASPSTPSLMRNFMSSPIANIPLTPSQDDDSNNENNEGTANHEFIEKTKKLSEARNLKLEHVLNARDLATCKHSPIKQGRVFRTGRLSDAVDPDIHLLMDTLHLKTLVDLRSPTELKEDTHLMREDIFGNFTNVVWKDRGRTKEGCIQVLKEKEFPVKDRFWKRSKRKDLVDDMIMGKEDPILFDDCDECGELGALIASQLQCGGQRKERLFVPLMNEFKYVKGTVTKLRKRDVLRAVLKSPGSLVSKRVRNSIKKPFLDEINGGGLQMLNELLFRYGAPGIRFVLELCADENRHPVAFYCTAGKDRTGAIAAIILALCGVDIDNIIEDYSLSASVYAEMGDHKAMVGALSQRNLDPKVFLGAPPQVMQDTLVAIKEHYGSIEAYCEWMGFGKEKQQQLRKALLK